MKTYRVHWDENGKVNRQTNVTASSAKSAISKVRKSHPKGRNFAASVYKDIPRTATDIFGRKNVRREK